MNNINDYRVVVGIDFGTTHSGFAYAHKRFQNVIVHSEWQEYSGRFKTPTILLYDDEYKNVQSWGFSALNERSNKNKKNSTIIENFLSRLGKNNSDKQQYPLPLDYKKAITDYLHEISKVIKQTLNCNLKFDFYTQALIILTIPTEFDYNAIAIMRECAFKAGLLSDQYSRNLKFITEPEAAAIHCMKYSKDNLLVGETFMVVDCGGGTVNSTTIQLFEGERLNVLTERNVDDCGGNFVDQEFLKFLENKVGSNAINFVKKNKYFQIQYLIQEFCRRIKIEFTGIQSEFQSIELELNDICPALTQHCEGEYLDNMKEEEWIINLTFDDVKNMFDSVIERIIKLIERSINNCTALLLVGGFSESKYLQSRIKEEFNKRLRIIYIPNYPVTAVMEGAVQYGLKWTYDNPERNNNAIESVTPYTNSMRIQLTESFDTIKNLDEEKELLQNEIKGINNKLYNYESLYNDLRENYKGVNDINQQHQNKIKYQDQLIDQLQNSSMDLKQYESCYNYLQKKYNDLMDKNDYELSQIQNLKNDIQQHQNKILSQDQLINQLQQLKEKHDNEYQIIVQKLNDNNKEIDQYQIKIESHEQIIDRLKQSLELKENQIKSIEEQHLKNIQQLENQTNDINQQHQVKIESHEQRIVQLQKSLELKENETQESNNNINKLKSLYNELKEKHEDLINKNNKEHQTMVQKLNDNIQEIDQYQIKIESQDQKIDQLQQSLELKENQIKRIEEQHLRNIQQLENQTNDINQQRQVEIESQEQKIDQLKQSLELKENQIKRIKEQHLRNIQQLETQTNDINQQYQVKTESQEKRIGQLQQSLELKIDQIKEIEETNLGNVQQLENQIVDINQQHQVKIELQEQRIGQLQQSLELKIDQTKEIERTNLRNIQQLENQIIDINQQHQRKVELQEQRIDQLQQSLELKEIEIHEYNDNINKFKSLNNELQEKHEDLINENDKEYQTTIQKLRDDINEYQIKIGLQEQRIDQLQQSLELREQNSEKGMALDFEYDSLYQSNSLLEDNEDNASNYQLENVMKLRNDISELNDILKNYVTDLKQDVVVNMEEVKKLLLLYKCPTKITNQKNDRLLIQAVLQRHVIETIFSYATKYFQSTGQYFHLESDIVSKAYSLSTLLTNASKYRTGNEEVTRVASIKMRQQIYSILIDRGFTNIFGEDNITTYEHPFIVNHKEKLNRIMNDLRIIKDDQKEIESENLAATIIHEVVRMFWFRFKVPEPVVQYVWIPYNAQMDKTIMEGDNINDSENLYVDLCYFPLIGRDLKSSNRKIYTSAKVFIRKD